MKKIILSICVSIITLSSCSFYTHYLQTGSKTYKPTEPTSIQIFEGDIDQSYTVIGSVTADAAGDGEAAANHLKKNASKLGADAIIHASLTKINSFSPRTGITGVAVKLD